jgi:hypothetical protein
MSVSNIAALQDKIQAGKQSNIILPSIASGAITAVAVASGGLSGGLHWNAVGTTLHSTLVGFVLQPGASVNRLIGFTAISNRAIGHSIVNLYQVGTLNLTTSSGEFTHDAATFPILRTKMGQASQPIALTPYIYITTATLTTAAVFTIDYVNQDGASVTGTIATTLPATNTAVGTLLRLPLEAGDSGVRDITDVKITTPAVTTGAATIFLAEILDTSGIFAAPHSGFRNSAVRSPNIPLLSPGVATSGTASVKSTARYFGATGTTISVLELQTFMDV